MPIAAAYAINGASTTNYERAMMNERMDTREAESLYNLQIIGNKRN